MDKAREFEAMVAALERNPELRGRRVADVPKLAEFRVRFRRHFYHWAEVFFALAILNAGIVFVVDGLFAVVSAFGLAIAVAMLFASEFNARTLTRQLHRRAAEQVARDFLGIWG
jgi:hypothetical protein